MNVAAPLVRLVDNDPRVLRALVRLLESEGLRTQASLSADEFLAQFDPSVPGCAILDLSMPDQDGLSLQAAMQRDVQDVQDVPVIFLSGCADVPSSVRAMKEGALDFLTKPVEVDTLLEAVHRGIEENRQRRARTEEQRVLHAALDKLTPREREILPYLVSGKLNKQIAYDLGVVEKTVKVHRTHVMEKLGVERPADLVRLADRLGITPAARARRPLGQGPIEGRPPQD